MKEELKKELKIFFENKHYLKNFYDRKTVTTKESELAFQNYSLRANIERIVSPFLIKNNFKTNAISFDYLFDANKLTKNDEVILYVNGICTTYDIAKYQAEWISKVTNLPVVLGYNLTDGLVVDLFESMINRTYKRENDASTRLYYELMHLTNLYKKVHVIGFSQGALITAKSILDLCNNTDIKNITYTTFASPCNDFIIPDDIECNHFANALDPVANIGILSHKEYITGNLFIQDKKGHLLIVDYLIPLILGKFGTDNFFFQYFIHTNNFIEGVKNNLSENHF